MEHSSTHSPEIKELDFSFKKDQKEVRLANPSEAMMIPRDSSLYTMRSLVSAILVLPLGGIFMLGQTQAATLSDNNSTVYVATGSQAGMYQWLVDGINQVYQQQFWYRVGPSGPEASIDTIGAPAVNQVDSRHLDLLYTSANNYSVDVLYVLSGNSPGSGNSGINATITVKNLSGNGLDFHLYQYSDFDLGATASGQSVAFSSFAGHYNKATQTGGTLSLNNTFTSGFNPPTHVEAAWYPQTLNELNTMSGLVLNGNASIGAGDATYAIQWDVSLLAMGNTGDSLQISELQTLHVPEPTALALLSSGTLVLTQLRRRRQA